MERSPVDIKKIINELLSELRPLLKPRQLQAVLNTQPGQETMVWGDETRLLQVLRNIMANAIRFSPDAGLITLSIGYAEWADQPMLELVVSDRGPGIAQDELENIFEAFVQGGAQPAVSTSSTGLGLSICRQIVKAHQGHIHARNRTGGGAELVVLLPRVTEAEMASESELESDPA